MWKVVGRGRGRKEAMGRGRADPVRRGRELRGGCRREIEGGRWKTTQDVRAWVQCAGRGARSPLSISVICFIWHRMEMDLYENGSSQLTTLWLATFSFEDIFLLK